MFGIMTQPAVQFPENTRRLGRWLGVAHDVGGPMCFWVLPKSCRVVARATVHVLTVDEMADLAVRVQISELDAAIHDKIGDSDGQRHGPRASRIVTLCSR
jgi:hypothetical protein